MSELQALQGLLSTLPEGTNVYLAVLQYILYSVAPPPRPNFNLNLYIILILDSLVVLFGTCALIVHLYRRSFWIFRTVGGPNGKFIMCHGVIGWLVGAMVFYSLTLVYIVKLIEHNKGVYVHGLAALSLSVVWVPGFVSAWFELWSISASYLHKQTNSTSFLTSGLFFNTIAISVPFICLGTLVPYAVITQINSDKVNDAYVVVETILLAAAPTFNPETFNIVDLLPALGPVQALNEASAVFFKSVTTVASLLALWSLVLLIPGLTFSILQLRSLSVKIKAADYNSGSKKAWSTKGQEVKSTYYFLVGIIITFTVMVAGVAGIGIFIALKPELALGQATAIEAYTLSILYIFAVPGVAVDLFILIKTLRAGQSTPAAQTSFTIPISINTQNPALSLSYSPWTSPNDIRSPDVGLDFEERVGSNKYSVGEKRGMELVEFGHDGKERFENHY